MWKKLPKKFSDTPILFRLSCILFTVFFIMFLLSYINFISFSSEKKKSTFQMVNQTNHQAISKIDDYIHDISNITKFPLNYRQYDTSYVRALEEFNNTNTSNYLFQIMNDQMFNEIIGYKDNIDSCFVFNLYGMADYKVRTSINKAMNPKNLPWFAEVIDSFGRPVVVDTYEFPHTTDNKYPVYVFGVARGIVRIETGNVIGVLLVNTGMNFFKTISNNMKITEGHRILILHDDKVVYDTIVENIGRPPSEELTSIKWDPLTEEMLPIEIQNEKMLAASLLSSDTGWRIISLIPSHELFYELEQMQKSTIIFSGIFIFITLLLIYALSSQIVNPIKRMAALMRFAEESSFDTKLNIAAKKDEIGILASSFNSMNDKINNLIQEVYIEHIKQTELEVQMLQAQINPHFIYNTLESISMMATINDDDTTSEMAACLGSILRYGISKNTEIVSVKDEKDNLEKYIYLQNIRFSSMYTFKLDISPDLYNISIIKLILQPIVENAIYHGMKDIRKGGIIEINGYKKDRYTLIFKVIDNGKGMERNEVDNLNGYINDENQLYHSIGLRNVNKRVKLKYGNEYGVSIESSPDIGTTVTVTLPIPR